MSNNINIEALKYFANICDKYDIWYTVIGNTLLNIKSEKKFTSNNIIEVGMSIDSFRKLINYASSFILDSSVRNDFFYSNPFFVDKEQNHYVKIIIFTESKIEKIQKFYSIKNLLRQKIGLYKTNYKYVKGFNNYFKKTFFSFLNLFWSPLIWQEICSNVYDEKFNGYFLIDSFKPNINKNWLPSISFDREEVVIDKNVKIYIFKEWETFLSKRYGLDWKTNPILEKETNYIWLNNIKH